MRRMWTMKSGGGEKVTSPLYTLPFPLYHLHTKTSKGPGNQTPSLFTLYYLLFTPPYTPRWADTRT